MAIIAALAVGGYAGFKEFKKRMGADLALNARVANITDKIDAIKERTSSTIESVKERAKKLGKGIPAVFALKGDEELPGITLYLKHGGVMSGKLVSKTDGEYVIEWKGERYVVDANQVKDVILKTQKEAEWAYKNDVAVKRTNGIVADGKIIDANENGARLLFDEGGGALEMGIDRKDIDYLMFAPVYNKEGEEIEKRLRELFPKMKIYREGNVVLFTDSHEKTAESYRKTLRAVYTDIYLKFFKAFKNKKPLQQNFVVVFDDFGGFANYAISDLVPFWAVLGYFSPTGRTLYLYNGWGAKTEKLYYDWIMKTSDMYDETAGRIKDKYKDTSADIVIDGMAKELKDKYWDWYNMHKQEYTDETFSVLRHEFSHEVFHNWGLQDVILSKSNIDKKKMTEKQKEIMDAIEKKDYDKLEELFKEVTRLKTAEHEDLALDAAQSWLGEGVATYCGTDPLGATDEEWLFLYQDAQRRGELNPIEFLMNFKMGSFPGLVPKAQIESYAESWAFTNFLMVKYPDRFMEYQLQLSERRLKKGAGEKAKTEDDLALLLKSLNKDLPALEKEFKEYMAAYPQAEDPFVKKFMRYEKIKDAYMDVFRRHGG